MLSLLDSNALSASTIISRFNKALFVLFPMAFNISIVALLKRKPLWF